jgi:DNA-binding transcriptional LysR family regulator
MLPSRCFLTPAALSLQIKALEQELALTLFDHKGCKLELTPHCEIYVEATKVLNSVEEAKEKTKNHAADFSGKSLWWLRRGRFISICRALPASAPRTLASN